MDKSGLYSNVVLAAAITVIFLYLWRVKYLVDYMRRAHTATWEKLGRPVFGQPPSVNTTGNIGALIALSDFILVSRQHRSLGDAALTRQLWQLRALFVIGFVLMLVAAIVDLHGSWAAPNR